jgi:hypothetical protein
MSSLVVHSLICHAHVGMAVTCLSSLYRCSDRPVDLRLHDDGSITADDFSRLKAAFPTGRLVGREEADHLAAEGLRSLPLCLEFRSTTVMAFKLFDPLLMGREPFLMLDTDILFFNAFENLCDPSHGAKSFIYMEDYVYSYSVMPWETFLHPELRPLRRFNAGMAFVPAAEIDLEYIEHLLRKYPHLIGKGHVTEQTLWGILGSRHGARKWNPRQVSIVTKDFRPSEDQVAAHFVSPSRHRLEEFASGLGPGATGRRIRVQTEPATPYNSVTAVCDYLGHRLTNRLYKLRRSLKR